MTREEAIKFGNLIITMARFDSDNYSEHTEEFTKLAVEAIENQKSIIEELEKIKTKLEYMAETQTIVENRVGMAYHKSRRRIIFEDDALEIIDKYISELKGE